ncbi:MAG TPA: DUF2185 domain-containing protein [Gemmataceae bacterium]|nr:DUF2185 domain-containing protein [Gemmataceae bacterium]
MNVQGACIASNLLTAGGGKVGYMYRNEPSFNNDTGWVFLRGHETQEYLDNSNNCAVCDIRAITEIDPDIVAFLDAPIGSALVRDPESDQFEPAFGPENSDDYGHEPVIPYPRKYLPAQPPKAGVATEIEEHEDKPPLPKMPPASNAETMAEFCEKCGLPIEYGEAEIRTRTESSIFGGLPAIDVRLCAKCADRRDGTGDRMIWGFAMLIAILVIVGLVSGITNLFLR